MATEKTGSEGIGDARTFSITTSRRVTLHQDVKQNVLFSVVKLGVVLYDVVWGEKCVTTNLA